MARTRLTALVLCTFFAVALSPRIQADPLADLAKYSVFPAGKVDLSALSGGAVQTLRGPVLNYPRDLTVQAVYLVHAPVGRALQMHEQWDAGKHSELNVYLHHDFSTHPTPADFTLPIPGNAGGAFRRLSDETAKLPAMGDLQLSKGEAAAYKNTGSGSVQAFWSQLLFQRATAFLAHGLSGLPPYESADGSARVSDEVNRLLSEQPKVRDAFASVISHPPIGGGVGSVLPYWELFDVEGKAAYSLGAASWVKTGDSAQMADLEFYASGGYYCYLTLYQMWPVTVNGKAATLVWRVDSISSLELGGLRSPMDRMGSGAAMMGDIKRIVNFFKKDVGG
jgi:hypothetical protein